MALWRLLREFMARYAESAVRMRAVLETPEQIVEMARVRLAGCPHEEVWAVLVDAGNRPIVWVRLEQGTVNGSVVHIRKLLEQVIQKKASGIILVHNHPGGTNKPSGPDIETTRKLHAAANTLGLRLIDHYVLTDTDFYSFRQDRLL